MTFAKEYSMPRRSASLESRLGLLKAMADKAPSLLDAEALKLWYSGNGSHTTTIVTVGVVLLVTFILFFSAVVASRRKRRDTILILGLSGAGKTALFYQLRDATTHQGTVTSMAPNEDKFVLHSESSVKTGKIKPVHVVDVPGHPKLRSHLDDYIPKAQGIVFVVDALDIVHSLRPTAEYLYEVLSNPVLVKRKVPLLIACNKCDKVIAHSPDFIRRQLERELDKLRGTRTALEGSDLNEIIPGIDGKTFSLDHCANRITIAETSALTGKIGDVEKFIREQVKP